MKVASKSALLKRLRREAKRKQKHRTIDKHAKRRARARQSKQKEAKRLERLHEAAQKAKRHSKEVLQMSKLLRAAAKRMEASGEKPTLVMNAYAPIRIT